MAGEAMPLLRNPNKHAHPTFRDAVDVTRFWTLVDRGRQDECWGWGGYLDDNGYGIFQWQGKRVGAHVLALSFTTGEARADGMDTRHSCDNPPCVNPSHLAFGTRKENVQDMLNRGRSARRGKLTDEQIIEIRERRAAGARQVDLAQQYEVSGGLISMIVRGKRWADVVGPIEEERAQYRKGA